MASTVPATPPPCLPAFEGPLKAFTVLVVQRGVPGPREGRGPPRATQQVGTQPELELRPPVL